MKLPTSSVVTPDPWSVLRQFTDARIGLGRCGTSMPLAECLAFKLAHAKARDAVWQPMQMAWLKEQLAENGHDCLHLASSVTSRGEYLARPDKGRILNDNSRALLTNQSAGFDLCIVVSDGLSARAIHENCPLFIRGFMEIVKRTDLTVAPICLVENGRVAIADEIGSLLSARMSIMLIGERPGLSSPNSLGVYLTYNPRPGTTDASRNCISNIREGGMTVEDGVRKLAYLVEAGLQQGKTGVELKDMMRADYLPFGREWSIAPHASPPSCAD